MAYRNPSPPPDLLPCEEDKDCISETVLSKSWLLSVMVNTVEESKYRRPCKQQTAKSSSEHQSEISFVVTCRKRSMHSQDLVIIMHALVMRSDSHWKAIITVLLALPYIVCGHFVFAML